MGINEFKKAIKGERMLELSLTTVLQKMGVEIGNTESRFRAFKDTEKRRRLMKKEWEARVSELTAVIVKQLAGLSKKPVPQKDEKLEKMYITLRDTFNAFNNDGSAELGFSEYKEAWAFLNRPGGPDEVKRTFDSIDVDGTGFIEWNEFAFSLMGEGALKFGPLADLELLQSLLSDTAHLLVGMQGDLDEANMSVAERQARNAELKGRLQQMRREMGSQMGNLMGKMMSIFGQDPAELLTEEQIDRVLNATFKKFDKDGSGILELPEFLKAWRSLELKGTDEEIQRSFTDVDTDNSGVIERPEFLKAIKGSRMAELSLSVLMTQMDGKLDGLEDIFNEYKTKREEAE